MKAIAVVPGTTKIALVEREAPSLTSPDELKVKIIRVGICGTDREEAAGGRALAGEGHTDLVIGHEMFGQVVETGTKVTGFAPGDYCILSVRRGCGECLPCAMNRSDMCLTGKIHERGIWGLDGYQAEYVVEKEQYAVHVPADLEGSAVLAEPLAVAEKAIDEAVRVQMSRLPDASATPDFLYGRRCLVAGLGPIGLLAALALRLRDAEVYGLDIVDPGTARPKWLEAIGGKYVDGRAVPPEKVDDVIGPMELILEATGVPSLAFNLLDALGQNALYVLTGIPGGHRPLQIEGADLVRRLVLGNQLMLGSVNESIDHFQMAIRDLAVAQLRWGDHTQKLITHRYPYKEFSKAFTHHEPDEIKAVIEWT
jgi:threonine dehydrogenase-like Zn-dependent dehydrogenase